MKLEEGMYVRSKINGMIGKITDIEMTKVFDKYLTVIKEETRYILDNNYNRGFCETEKDSVKASYNIIDLIEVGDYVNGELILEKVLYGNNAGVKVFGDIYYSEDIKSIVTKEQFESMSYKVGEE